jgi:riboflavin-specific deaminase-like protein
MKRNLPFVFSNFAMTADGKIAFENHTFVPFGSTRDHEHMMELRATADAVICGARTIEQSQALLGPGAEKYRRERLKRGLPEYNLRVIVSGTASINPNAKIFKHRFSPIIILTAKAGAADLNKIRAVADKVMVCGDREIDFPAALRWLRKKWNVKRLLCEGGGRLHGALVRANLVDEVHLTICPKIFGGRRTPTLADGQGISTLLHATQYKLISSQRVEDELFLIFRRLNFRRFQPSYSPSFTSEQI